MEFRLWIGLWTALFLLLLVAFNLSFMVKYITRFTEDCFATLVAIIFIIDAIKSTLNLRKMQLPAAPSNVFLNYTEDLLEDDHNHSLAYTQASYTVLDENSLEYMYKKSNQQAVFYFSFLLFIMTFFICMTLKSFRNQPFLPSKVN
jgi:hypothetical protein